MKLPFLNRLRKFQERGVRLHTLHAFLAVSACVVSLGLLLMMRRTTALIAEAGVDPAVYGQFSVLMRWQAALTVLLLVNVIATILLISALVLWPLRSYIGQIKSYDSSLEMRGAYELRYFAQAYNLMHEEIERNNGHLLYQAEHDSLTGLFNRGAFDKLRRVHQHEHVGMMLIDVDKFKDVNDTYGHATGDLVLKKVATLLSGCFRATDYPCRIGGDEFAVIMTHISPSVKDVVRNKIMQVSDGLRHTEEDRLPAVTLSVGVAFSDHCLPGQDVYKLADAALYLVKDRGRNGFAFFDEESIEAV